MTNSLSFRANSTFKGPRPPRLVEHCWVPILGASCSNILLLGTVRPSHRKMPEKPSAKILRCWLAMQQIGMFFKIERCKMPAIRTPLRFGLRCERLRCQIASDVGGAMRATKNESVKNFQLHGEASHIRANQMSTSGDLDLPSLGWSLGSFLRRLLCNSVSPSPKARMG